MPSTPQTFPYDIPHGGVYVRERADHHAPHRGRTISQPHSLHAGVSSGRQRTCAAMQAAKRQGSHMGRVSTLPQTTGDALNDEKLTTATGAAWSPGSVAKVRHRLSALMS